MFCTITALFEIAAAAYLVSLFATAAAQCWADVARPAADVVELPADEPIAPLTVEPIAPSPDEPIAPLPDLHHVVVPFARRQQQTRPAWAEMSPAELRKACQSHGIRWRDVHGKSKHLRKVEMVAALERTIAC